MFEGKKLYRANDRALLIEDEEGEGWKRTAEKTTKHISGGDALRGHTRSHPEHEG